MQFRVNLELNTMSVRLYKNALCFASCLLMAVLFASCSTFTEPEWASEMNSRMLMMDLQVDSDELQMLNENRFSNLQVPGKLYYMNGENGSRRMVRTYLEAQGAGSRYFTKWGYTFTLDGNEKIFGLNRFNLSIQAYDKSKIRSIVTSRIFEKAGFHVFESHHAFLKINDKTEGLYLLTERVEEDFFNRRNIGVAELIKVVFGAKFSYESRNHLSDNFEKKIPDDDNYNNLADFISVLDTANPAHIMSIAGRYLNIRQYLTYHAVCSIINNVDGLTNNFYLYRSAVGKPYEIIPWDFDKSFFSSEPMGLYGDSDIIRKLFADQECYRIYKEIVRDLLETVFTEENLFPIIDSAYDSIREAYYKDPYLRIKENSLEDEVRDLKQFITERRLQLSTII